jgi:hypothetical protein
VIQLGAGRLPPRVQLARNLGALNSEGVAGTTSLARALPPLATDSGAGRRC